MDDLGIESAWELTGLYRGIPLTARSLSDVAPQPDLICLYRQPILLEWIETGEDLYRLVCSVLVHEIAHHFGRYRGDRTGDGLTVSGGAVTKMSNTAKRVVIVGGGHAGGAAAALLRQYRLAGTGDIDRHRTDGTVSAPTAIEGLAERRAGASRSAAAAGDILS